MDQKLHLDIRIIKFQDYISRKPDRPFGYYGLGVQHMLSGNNNLAEKMFLQALKKDPSYIPAKLGRLEVLLNENKLVAAARYYNKNSDFFLRKKLYMKRINNMTSRLYLSRNFWAALGKLRSLFLFDEKIGTLQKMFSNNQSNPVVNILLSMYFLKKHKSEKRAFTLYNLCVGMDGIIDKLRWDLVEILSKNQPEVLQDEKIAGLFQSISESSSRMDYVDFLLSCFMAQQDKEKVSNAFSELQNRHIIPSNKTMWEYINFCHSQNIWNATVALYCQKLIENGWINSFLSSVAIQLKKEGIVDAKNRMFKFLSLYGYYKA